MVHARHGHHHDEGDRFEARSGFGVRRPLRFLAHKLDLNEKQITELAQDPRRAQDRAGPGRG